MWCSSLFYLLVIISAFYTKHGSAEKENIKKALSNPVLIEINPGIFRSKDVMKFDSKNRRLKRGKKDAKDKPSLVLQLSPGFFSSPSLKNLYSSITGINDNNNNNPETKKDGSPASAGETKMVFQINPRMLPGLSLKREAGENEKGNDLEAFHLQLNPVVPRKLLPIRKYNSSCVDRMANELWCKSYMQYSLCPRTEPTIPTTTQCRPEHPRPSEVINSLHHICKINWHDHAASPNPCICENACPTTQYTTVFEQCHSSPEPTNKPTAPQPECSITCRDIVITRPTTPVIVTNIPPMTQKCDLPSINSNLIRDPPEKYFILVKRSPKGSWSRNPRKKRESARKNKYYIVPVGQ